VSAIKRSCNTWFYQVGRKTGAEQFLSVARRLGFGEQTGIPIAGEEAGRMPDEATYSVTVANLSIGQGALSATPLQVARAMAAVADGSVARVPRLVLQVQDLHNQVIDSFPVEVRNNLNLSKETLDTVRKGMWEVVNAGGGTGGRAAIKFCEVAGKTGTGEWRVDGDDRRVAWFAGYLPADDPKLAFAVLYEGGPGETVSGGRIAAPIVHDVFTKIYENGIHERIEKRLQKVLGEEPEAPDALASADADGGEEAEGGDGGSEAEGAEPPPRAVPLSETRIIAHGNPAGPAPAPEAEPEEPRGNIFRSLWRKIRGR
jgi:penicillin-binding protein 2